MSKSAGILLLVLGLAIGLWLGFNPQAHQQTLQTWDHSKTAFVQMTAKAPAVHAPTSTAKPAPAVAPTASNAWKQITIAFESMLHSLQRLWLNVTARIRTTQ